MDRNELKRRWIMGTIQPELFYIPWGHRKKGKSGIYISAYDELGNLIDAITGIYFSYRTYQFFHNLYYDTESGQWIVDIDTSYKGYAFETNYDWRYVVPNPSQWEKYPIPDLSQAGIIADDATVNASSSSVNITTNSPLSTVHIDNLPVGSYSVSVSFDNEKYYGLKYYPDYYNNERYEVSHDSGSVQIDRSGKFSGFYYYALSDPVDSHPIGYDFYGMTTKFENNNMPVVLNRYDIPDIKYVVTWIDISNVTNHSLSQKGDHGFNRYYRAGETAGVPWLVAVENWKSSVTYGKILGIKVYVNGEYKGVFAKLPQYSRVWSQPATAEWVGIADIHDYGYIATINDYADNYHWGMLDGVGDGTGRIILPIIQNGFLKNANVIVDYSDSYGHTITLDEATHAGYEIPEEDYYIKEFRDSASIFMKNEVLYCQKSSGAWRYVLSAGSSVDTAITSVEKYGGYISINLKKNITNQEQYYSAICDDDFTDHMQSIKFGELKTDIEQISNTSFSPMISVGSLVTEIKIAESGQQENYSMWNGVYPEFDSLDGNKIINYYYIDGITSDELKEYSNYFETSHTTVDFEEI